MNKVKNSNDRNQLGTDTQHLKTDELDMETTIADMNVEGMPWYKPDKRGGGQGTEIPPLSKSEQRALVRGALMAALPLIGGLVLVLALVFGLAYLWLS